MIFILQSIQTILFIFIVILTIFRQIRPLVFFRCFLSNLGAYREPRNVPFSSCTCIDCSYSATHDRVHLCTSCYFYPKLGLKLQPPGDFTENFFNQTLITVKPYFLPENTEWILATYKDLKKTVGHIILYFGLRPGQKYHSKVMHRKEETHSNGSYERKSRGRKLDDEMVRGKKNSHGTLIDWCTGREWPVNCMTVISAWWRSNMRFQRSCRRLNGRGTII